MVEYGPRGLDLLAKGVAPQAVLQQLLADDASRESRQVGVIDMTGRAAAHTGKQNGNWAGSRQGRHYTVQANIMVGPEVIEAVAASFESTDGAGLPLAERMILAMEAGQAKGGDRRWGLLQSAAIKIADPNDPGRGGDYISLAIEVGEHSEPVAELKRIYYTTARRLGYRTFSNVEGPDVIELKRMLHALGYWRPALAVFPDPPPPTNTPKMRELQKADPVQYDKVMSESRRASADYTREYSPYDAEAIASVDKFRADRGINYQGNPAGLVDARLVEALRSAYFEKKKRAPGRELDAPSPAAQKQNLMTTHARGTFDVKLNPLPAYDTAGGSPLGRMSIDKQFHGDFEATSKGEMLTAGTGVNGSAGYVAIERVTGTLQGRSGSFILQHNGTMTRGEPQLTITVVPDSGTGQLAGLAGRMSITIADGKHSYDFDYTLSKTP
jgi:uncharacterized Ntn-hydrolase superfamily protein